jgi:uncharacterized protein (UPF0303 family)
VSRPVPEYTVAELEYLNQIEFPGMTNDDAVVLGIIAVEVIREWGLSLAVEIVLGDDVVFRAKLKTTGPGNDQWLAGKAAVARHFGEASLLVKNRHLEAGTDVLSLDVDHDKLKFHGGSIPLRVGGATIGTITTSGEPDAVDHEVSAEAVRRYLAAGE